MVERPCYLYSFSAIRSEIYVTGELLELFATRHGTSSNIYKKLIIVTGWKIIYVVTSLCRAGINCGDTRPVFVYIFL